jgi:hypothetical protein
MIESPEPLRYGFVQRSVRPPRAATFVCADGDWRADLLRMMECYSRTWGGDGNGLVASSSSWAIAESFWPLLTALDPDHWAVFHRTRRGLRMSDPAAYEALLSADAAAWVAAHGGTEADARQTFETEQFLSDAGSGPVPTPLDERIRHWFAPLASQHVAVHASYKADEPPSHGLVDMCQLTYRPARSVEIDTASLPPEVQLLVAARTGRLAPGHLAHLEGAGNFSRSLTTVGDDELSQLLEFAWTGQVDMALPRLSHATAGNQDPVPEPTYGAAGFLGDTPFAQSRLGCTLWTKVRPRLDEEPVVVICGDSAEDFCYAFTRQRVVGNTYWLPVAPGGANDELGHVLRETMTRVLSRYAVAPTGNRTVLLSSLTYATAQLEEVLGELSATIWGRDFNSDKLSALAVRTCEPNELPVRRDQVLLDSVHFGDSLHEPFLGAELARNVEIPLPSEATGLRAESCRWQVDIETVDNVLPARWALHTALTVGDELSRWAARSSTSGISVDSHGRGLVFSGSPLSEMLVQVRLRFPGAAEIFTTLLSEAGVTLEESDKGRYTRRMIELWGDISALADDLRTGPAWSLLSSWVSDETGGDIWRIQGRNYLRLDDVSRATGLAAGESRHLLDRYQHRSIAARGLVLKCSLCARTSFYRLEDLGPGFRCERCRRENEIARAAWKGPDEPEWFYALDEVAYQGLTSNIHVPILALAELSKSTRSFLHMPEAVVHRPGHADMEVDIWAVIDGRIVIGEAKKSNQLESSDRREKQRCAGLRTLVADLTADEFVMATAGSAWSERSKNNVERTIGSSAPVHWLTDLH